MYRSFSCQKNILKHKPINIKGRIFRFKYCKTCKIFRPLGSSHCHECNNCVERYDHHCPWIGNCVGRNNYRYFFYFLSFYNVLLIYNIIINFIILNNIINENNHDFHDFLLKESMCFVQIILSIAVFIL